MGVVVVPVGGGQVHGPATMLWKRQLGKKSVWSGQDNSHKCECQFHSYFRTRAQWSDAPDCLIACLRHKKGERQLWCAGRATEFFMTCKRFASQCRRSVQPSNKSCKSKCSSPLISNTIVPSEERWITWLDILFYFNREESVSSVCLWRGAGD